MLINEIREQIKQKPISEALPIIDASELSLDEKYQLLRELYRVRCVEFDTNYRITGMTFDEWVRDDLDEWVGCFWPSHMQCEELEKYIYDDFLNNYKHCNIDMFADDYNRVKGYTFKYMINKLLFEQILVHPKIIKEFNNITKREIWNSLQWLIYLEKIKPEESLIEYEGEK